MAKFSNVFNKTCGWSCIKFINKQYSSFNFSEPTHTKQCVWIFLLKETMGAFDGVPTPNWLITSQQSTHCPMLPFILISVSKL